MLFIAENKVSIAECRTYVIMIEHYIFLFEGWPVICQGTIVVFYMESAYYVSLLLNFKFSMNVDLFVMMIRRWAYCGTSFCIVCYFLPFLWELYIMLYVSPKSVIGVLSHSRIMCGMIESKQINSARYTRIIWVMTVAKWVLVLL